MAEVSADIGSRSGPAEPTHARAWSQSRCRSTLDRALAADADDARTAQFSALAPRLAPPKKKQPHVPSVPQAANQLASVLSGLHHTFVVADNTLPDCPLVYASEG